MTKKDQLGNFELMVMGIVKLGERLTDSSHEDRPILLPRTPIPAGNHQLCRVGLSPFLYELP